MIKVEQLVKMGALRVNALKYVDFLNETCIKYNINTEPLMCAFLCQIYEETGALSNVRLESLKYTAKRMMQVWPSRFPTLESAKPYEMNPKKLAEKVYGGRGGNPPGTAYKYIGRGAIQITFFSNYKNCGEALGLDLINHPELLEEPKWAIMSAGWFWSQAKCNKLAAGDSLEAVKAVTKVINGGYGNLKMRQDYWLKAKKIGFALNVTNQPIPKVIISTVNPLPNVVLAHEKPTEVIQHNPIVKKSLIQSILELIFSVFKK